MENPEVRNLFGTTSFGGGGSSGGGGGGRSSSRTNLHQANMRSGVGVANTIAGQFGKGMGQNPRDPQGVHGRPTNDEGDAYSGNATYGGPAGR